MFEQQFHYMDFESRQSERIRTIQSHTLPHAHCDKYVGICVCVCVCVWEHVCCFDAVLLPINIFAVIVVVVVVASTFFSASASYERSGIFFEASLSFFVVG